ncbi:MAG: transporter [Sulfurimonas sp. RIFOXYD12_FULL_33_39]|uniref:CNNM domain-containing protein n=1 Tax=unclassified Sulfurimonas TaxID=2623549 RepID=UPI0008C2B47A|nr:MULTISPECIES: hemolysin family protein [unclassified Sulfurimonas]OHE06781.1 MAG: transporter [Sulfurimonas sp. RIFCSPLOWO2_12_FULL_34_6]OHE09729.1 MAG: transporter [Sulfurimonas sp. RIFOXYD12_FULL_33_39]OHE13763.1 MAG: transporter [Sulfurimonas sp. RIFOXYD2_FULL_34_21]DAB28687.1 MAG TPA: transporter [Sulfurimonas sp. UBA10385]
MTLLIIYLSVAILISFLCSILEAVLLSSTNSYIESLSKNHNENLVNKLKDLKLNIDKPISSILTVNTFAHTMGAAGVGAQAQILFGQEWQALVAFVVTLVILYLSEIIPKTIGALYWKKLLVPSAYVISFLVTISTPFTWVSSFLTNYISRNKKHQSNFSRDEIMAVVAMGEKEGAILSKESDLIENLLKLKNIKAKDIMTPRSVVFALPASTTVEEAIEDDRMYIYSRIPIFRDTLDDIVGMVFNQKILEESNEDHDSLKLENISHEVHMVSENLPVPTLIDQFVKRKTHLFIVYDSYGQTVGVVTLEDAIETLLGVEIVDEMDEIEDMQLFAKDRSKQFQDRMKIERKKLEKAKIQ